MISEKAELAIRQLVEMEASRAKRVGEDSNPFDVSGGNFDDAYYDGMLDGERALALDIITILNND